MSSFAAGIGEGVILHANITVRIAGQNFRHSEVHLNFWRYREMFKVSSSVDLQLLKANKRSFPESGWFFLNLSGPHYLI